VERTKNNKSYNKGSNSYRSFHILRNFHSIGFLWFKPKQPQNVVFSSYLVQRGLLARLANAKAQLNCDEYTSEKTGAEIHDRTSRLEDVNIRTSWPVT
jgi:hypothetical protein